MQRPLLIALLAVGCRSTPSLPTTPSAPPAPAPSALRGLGRALQALDELQLPGVTLRLRALESDALFLTQPPRERVRVFLHLTAWAGDLDTAREALAEAELTLGSLGSAVTPAGVLSERDWTPPIPAGNSSWSAPLRIEIATHEAPSGGSASPHALETVSADAFLRSVTEATGFAVQAHRPRTRRLPDGRLELTCRVTPASPDAHDTLAAIANFLEEVEARSPAARWTHLEVERALELPEGLEPNGWTFEGELTLAEG
jgi:hypothetical protein